MHKDSRVVAGASTGDQEPERLGRVGFAVLGGIIGLAVALVFLAVAPARKDDARPTPLPAAWAIEDPADPSDRTTIEAGALPSPAPGTSSSPPRGRTRTYRAPGTESPGSTYVPSATPSYAGGGTVHVRGY